MFGFSCFKLFLLTPSLTLTRSERKRENENGRGECWEKVGREGRREREKIRVI